MEHKTKRFLYLTFGWFMFSLGFIGVFLPVLPTTPFMILALWGFSRGSESLHRWLYNHPRFGTALRDWDQFGMIPLKVKFTAIFMMSISAVYLTFLSGAPNIAIIVVLGIMVYSAIYVMTRPSRIIEKVEPANTEDKVDPTDGEENPANTTPHPEP